MNVEVLKSIPVVGKKVRNNRTREALQALQRSATDPDLFVSSPKLMSKTEKKIEKSSELAFNIIKGDSSSKENAPVRRSKRKTPSTRKQPDKKISYENIENVSTTVPKVASKSKKVPSKKKIKTDLKNSKTDSLIPSLPDVLNTY
ncbi:hypothetical protein CDAR_604401 [Caerostris darwini]|uniref:Uncharacterized protein n=1 Tax=Caerostris darwini TaxID=1538125 RepID=A0AAV4M9D2_9ARAC|nr:hypothetical protein CDAR_604401 [Caerostris darwini]